MPLTRQVGSRGCFRLDIGHVIVAVTDSIHRAGQSLDCAPQRYLVLGTEMYISNTGAHPHPGATTPRTTVTGTRTCSRLTTPGTGSIECVAAHNGPACRAFSSARSCGTATTRRTRRAAPLRRARRLRVSWAYVLEPSVHYGSAARGRALLRLGCPVSGHGAQVLRRVDGSPVADRVCVRWARGLKSLVVRPRPRRRPRGLFDCAYRRSLVGSRGSVLLACPRGVQYVLDESRSVAAFVADETRIDRDHERSSHTSDQIVRRPGIAGYVCIQEQYLETVEL